MLALRVKIYADGAGAPTAGAILDRALFHLDNCYFLPNLHFEGRVLKTNHVSHTAFRGFGGPQGMLVVEEVLNRIAERLRKDPVAVRKRNYYGKAPRNLTPYGQEIKATDNRIHRMTRELLQSSDYRKRRQAIGIQPRIQMDQTHRLSTGEVWYFLHQQHAESSGRSDLIYADAVHESRGQRWARAHTKMLAICSTNQCRSRIMETSTEK